MRSLVPSDTRAGPRAVVITAMSWTFSLAGVSPALYESHNARRLFDELGQSLTRPTGVQKVLHACMISPHAHDLLAHRPRTSSRTCCANRRNDRIVAIGRNRGGGTSRREPAQQPGHRFVLRAETCRRCSRRTGRLRSLCPRSCRGQSPPFVPLGVQNRSTPGSMKGLSLQLIPSGHVPDGHRITQPV